MAENLRWDFVGNDRLSDVLEKIDKTLDKVDRSLGDFGRKAKTVAGDTKILEAEIVDLGDKAQRTDEKLHKTFRGLPAEIAAAELAVKRLTAQYAKTGDVDILKNLKGQRSTIKELENAKLDLSKWATEAAKEGQNFAQRFGSSMVDSLNTSFPSELRTIFLIAGGTVAVTLAPLIGGAVAAAVLGGVGLGGVVGGVVLAAQDNRVQSAFSTMGRELFATLKDTADPFIEPLLKVPARLRAEFAAAVPDLRGIFGDLSSTVDPLARGLAGLVREALPGIRRAVSASVPLINTLARLMPEIGRTLSAFFDSMERSGPGAEKALIFIVRVIEMMIRGLGILIELLSKFFDLISKVPSVFKLLTGHVAEFGDTSTSAFGDLGDAVSGATSDMRDFSDAFDAALNINLDSQHATIAYERAVDDLVKTLKENGRTLDIYTEKGRQNREAILGLVEAAEREKKANIDNGMAVEDANRTFAGHIEWLKKTAAQMGYNKQEVEQLIGATNDLPRDIGLNVRADGLAATISGFSQLKNSIAAALGAGGISVGGVAAAAKRKRALGGAVMPGQVYQVNEQRTEYFQPAMPGRITATPPGGSLPDETVLAPVALNLEGFGVWQGMLAFKRRSGKVSLGLA